MSLHLTPRVLCRFHISMVGVWSLLLIPTVLLWRESIIWVVFMSWYANFVGHVSAWNAARAEESANGSAGS